MASGTSGNRGFVEGIPIVDQQGNRIKYFNIAKGKIEDMIPTQKLVFDAKTGKLKIIQSPENKNIPLDNQVFVDMAEDGCFALSQFKNKWNF